MSYEKLWSHEQDLPEWIRYPGISVAKNEPQKQGVEPREISVDKYVTDVSVQPYIEGHKRSRRGGYASLTNYRM